MRNNAAEKLKLISKNNEYPLKQINTESLFKNKKVNNIQPISSKSNNSNPFRNSSKGIRDIKSKKNISSKKKIVVANLNSNSNNSFVVKDINYSKNKNKDILSHANNPGTEKSKRINNIILKNKNNNNLGKNKLDDNSFNNDNKNKNNEDKYDKFIK